MNDDFQDKLEELAPEKAQLVLETRVGKELVQSDLPAAILKVLGELPPGKIRRQRDALLVKGLTYLIRKVPDGHPEKSQIVASVLDAWKRSEKT